MGSPAWRWRRGLKPCPCSLSDSGRADAEHCRKQQRFLLRCAARDGRKAQEAKAREKRAAVLGAIAHRHMMRAVTRGKAHVSRHQRGLRAKRNRAERNRRDNGR